MAWVFGTIFLLCIVGSWISFIASYQNQRQYDDLKRLISGSLHKLVCLSRRHLGHLKLSIRRYLHNPLYLNRMRFQDLKGYIRNHLPDLRSFGIPDAYIGRYVRLTYADYPNYRKGIRQLVTDMKNAGIDVTPMEAMIQSGIDICYDD